MKLFHPSSNVYLLPFHPWGILVCSSYWSLGVAICYHGALLLVFYFVHSTFVKYSSYMLKHYPLCLLKNVFMQLTIYFYCVEPWGLLRSIDCNIKWFPNGSSFEQSFTSTRMSSQCTSYSSLTAQCHRTHQVHLYTSSPAFASIISAMLPISVPWRMVFIKHNCATRCVHVPWHTFSLFYMSFY